jgi:uncharacterized paraquat-inducible protein A
VEEGARVSMLTMADVLSQILSKISVRDLADGNVAQGKQHQAPRSQHACQGCADLQQQQQQRKSPHALCVFALERHIERNQ